MTPAPGFAWTAQDFRSQLKKSSFAPGALLLSAPARADLEAFYAFCRAVDDCADDHPVPAAKAYLRAWKSALSRRPSPTSPLLVRELWRLSRSRAIPRSLFLDLIQGAEGDLKPVRLRDRRALELYCHRVAGVVGQACLPIFGLDLKRGRGYAEALGRAFQLINIVRDLKEDSARGRLYFALSDLKRHKVSAADFMAGRAGQSLIAEYAAYARSQLEAADRLAEGLPAPGLRPSRLMRRLYGALLDRMEDDGLKVFERRYRLSVLRKLAIVAGSLFP